MKCQIGDTVMRAPHGLRPSVGALRIGALGAFMNGPQWLRSWNPMP